MHICLVFFFVVVDIIDDVGYSKEKTTNVQRCHSKLGLKFLVRERLIAHVSTMISDWISAVDSFNTVRASLPKISIEVK